MFFGFGLKQCTQCGHRHGPGRCCIDIYQQLTRSQGPSIAGKILLAFVIPMVVFMASLVGAHYLVFRLTGGSNELAFISVTIAIILTFASVQLIRWLTRRPVHNDAGQAMIPDKNE